MIKSLLSVALAAGLGLAASGAYAQTTTSATLDAVKAKGYILYPGKLTEVETFRVGCIGCVNPDGMRAAVDAVAQVLREMNVNEI